MYSCILYIAVKVSFLFASYQQFHGLLLFICSSFHSMNIAFFTFFFFLNKEETHVVYPIKDGFKVLWYIFLLLIGTAKALCVCSAGRGEL